MYEEHPRLRKQPLFKFTTSIKFAPKNITNSKSNYEQRNI